MSSHYVALLTTSEGRDKMFKVVQCLVKILAWALMQRGLLPDGEAGSRDYWVNRLRVNAHTLRNGRALFKLGRWIATMIDLAELLPKWSASHEQSSSSVVALLLLRAVLVIVRSILRDLSNLIEKNLFGLHAAWFHKTELAANNSMWSTAHAYITSLNWVTVAGIDLFLLTQRICHEEWIPPAHCLSCKCNPAVASVARLEFPPLDLTRFCPLPRCVEFASAANPKDMQVRCRECGVSGPIGTRVDWMKNDQRNNDAATAVPKLAFPRLVAKMLTCFDVIQHHPNLRENVLLVAKATCDLTHSVCCAMMTEDESVEWSRPRALVSNVSGLLSASIALRRVWISDETR